MVWSLLCLFLSVTWASYFSSLNLIHTMGIKIMDEAYL